MLTLTRRVGEKLVVGNNIIIEVVAVNGKGIQLGIVAPRETSIHRFEVFQEIQAANLAATASAHTNQELRASVGDLAARLVARHSTAPHAPAVAAEAETIPAPDLLSEGAAKLINTRPVE